MQCIEELQQRSRRAWAGIEFLSREDYEFPTAWENDMRSLLGFSLKLGNLLYNYNMEFRSQVKQCLSLNSFSAPNHDTIATAGFLLISLIDVANTIGAEG